MILKHFIMYMQSAMDNETVPMDLDPPISHKKKAKEEFIMPTKETYSLLLSHNYTIKQLIMF